MSKRFVLYSPDPTVGIFLGECLGLGFWSLCDPVGQPSAVTFESEADAAAFAARWSEQPEFPIEIRPVEADEPREGRAGGPLVYASVAACVRAGLPGWDPNAEGRMEGTMVSRETAAMVFHDPGPSG